MKTLESLLLNCIQNCIFLQIKKKEQLITFRENHGSQIRISCMSRNAPLTTSPTTWVNLSMWSHQNQTSSLTLSALNVCGKTKLVTPSGLLIIYNTVVYFSLKLYSVFEGMMWLYGCWFYRPSETFHVATRKFLEKEVFKSDYYNRVPISKVLGKCVVVFVKVRLSSTLKGETNDSIWQH